MQDVQIMAKIHYYVTANSHMDIQGIFYMWWNSHAKLIIWKISRQ